MSTTSFTITIFGAGNIGGTLGRKWCAAGHQIAFGVSDPNGKNAQALRAELGNRTTIGTVDEALATTPDIVVMAVPGVQMDALITKHAAQLDGRIIIDTANRLDTGPLNSFATFHQHTPAARLFRAFNTLGWESFANPVYNGVQADLFYCGPQGEPGARVERLIADIGLNPVWLGDDEQVSLVDALGKLWLTLVFGQGKDRNLAFKMLTR